MPAEVPVDARKPYVVSADELDVLRQIEERVQWISTYTIHHANHVRPNQDGLKVGGHQASCASINTLLTALYLSVLSPRDRVAVKPHASPVFHAIQYLLGRQTRDKLEAFRAFGGAQSYPSRTKDTAPVDFSTGSVGLGVAVTAFASIVQDYLQGRDWLSREHSGRMIALLGDAELDEGNIYEALIEAYKHDVRNVWWIVDYNRQSLDAVTSDRMFTQFEDFFRSVGWEVVTLKYGKRQEAMFREPGGEALRAWIDAASNALYAALTFQGGAAWRERLNADLSRDDKARALIARYSDAELSALMTDHGGHCMETCLEAFHGVKDDKPRLFIAYTTKGHGLPFQGHKDNHSGLMNPAQLKSYQQEMGVPEGHEWEPFAGLEAARVARIEAFLKSVPLVQGTQENRAVPKVELPDEASFPLPSGDKQSTQAAFGKILQALSREKSDFADRIVTSTLR